MIDAAAKDALDALAACPCCLLGPQQRCLQTPYTHLGNTEIYSDMLKECFNIQLDVASDKCGICQECVVRLRDASHFKRQVQRSQVQLQERLARALKIIEEQPPVTFMSETADENRTSDNLSVEEPPVEMADDTGMSEDSVGFEEPGVNSEAADDDGTSDNSSASLNQSEMRSRAQATALDRTCSVSLDQMFVDTEHHTCRVGSQTYKLNLYSRSPLPIQEGKGNKSISNLKNAEIETAGEQKASVSRPVYSVTNEDVGEMAVVKHSKTANITKETTPYKCSRCRYASAKKGQLVVHERTHTGEKPYKCNRCSYASGDRSNLLVHKRKHTGEKPYKCSLCSYASAHKRCLRGHERKHTDQKPEKFSHCSDTDAQKSLLLVHERKHTGNKRYKCSHCGYAGAQKSQLVVHLRTHTGEKPYKCNRCSYASGDQSNLLAHKRKHTGEKPYKCSHCSYASAYKSSLRGHERNHTGDKPYKCSYCSYASISKSRAFIHERTHNVE